MNGSLPGALYTAGPRQSIYTRGRANETNRRRGVSLPCQRCLLGGVVFQEEPFGPAFLYRQFGIIRAVLKCHFFRPAAPKAESGNGSLPLFQPSVRLVRAIRSFPLRRKFTLRGRRSFVRSVSFFLCPEYRQRQYCLKFGRLPSSVRLVHRGQTFHSS